MTDELRKKYEQYTEGKTTINKYEKSVVNYEAKSQEKGKIVFFGSSMFTRWSERYNNVNLEDVLLSSAGEKMCINHGIGGSNIAHNIYYYERMVKAYEPKALVLSIFGNYAISYEEYHYTQEQVWEMIEYFMELVRRDFPDINVYFSVNETRMAQKKAYLLEKIKGYCAAHEKAVCVAFSMEEYYAADKTGHVGSDDFMNDVYIEDKVHFTPLGYSYFADIWRKALKDELG